MARPDVKLVVTINEKDPEEFLSDLKRVLEVMEKIDSLINQYRLLRFILKKGKIKEQL